MHAFCRNDLPCILRNAPSGVPIFLPELLVESHLNYTFIITDRTDRMRMAGCSFQARPASGVCSVPFACFGCARTLGVHETPKRLSKVGSWR